MGMGAVVLETVSPQMEDGTDHVALASVELRVETQNTNTQTKKIHAYMGTS